jgi:hypothetical protein
VSDAACHLSQRADFLDGARASNTRQVPCGEQETGIGCGRFLRVSRSGSGSRRHGHDLLDGAGACEGLVGRLLTSGMRLYFKKGERILLLDNNRNFEVSDFIEVTAFQPSHQRGKTWTSTSREPSSRS